ncbi:MFS transporter [Tropicibacter sp. R16_0]|uniref:MFS transporter n=1 Tax=Tropicibacter sp. R16_0 TaxID=2821102 RepID=UPI001ADA6238|nr:MFS transporter [Tropicibacter sp. R16_0]MBO9452048.1 MFS transporter [Tropicibacter sp. R16_0]
MTTNDDHTTAAGWRDILRGRYAAASAVLAAGIALHAINITLSATMLPSIVAEIGGQDLYAWNATLPTLAAILSAAVTGRLLRRTGARLGFGLAALVFGTGSLLAALALSMPVLIVGRVVQGAGGGMLFTLCYSMIVVVYPEWLWSRAMALLSGTWGITMLFGPAVGGIFAELDMWRLGFGIMLPVAGLFVVLTLRLLPKTKRDHAASDPIAFGQLALLAGAVLAVSLGSIAPSPLWALVAVTASVLMIVTLLRREHTGRSRLFPRGAATPGAPLFLALAVMSLLIFGINAEFFMPFYLQKLHAMSPLMAGYIAALVSIGWAVSEVWSARFTGREMHRAVLSGPLLMLVACILLGTVTPLYDSAGLVATLVLSGALIGLGVGIGIGWPHLNTFILQFTDDDERDMAASALSTVQMFSVAFGTALAGLVGNFTGFNDDGNLASIANSAIWLFVTFGAVAVLAALVARQLIKSHKGARNEAIVS